VPDVGVAGLTEAEVADRVAAGHSNRTPSSTSRPLGEILRANLLTRFNAIVGTLCVLALVFGAPGDALFGLVAVVNSALGISQGLRARRVLDRLAVPVEEPVRVRRDGVELSVPPDQVVLDDLVLLGAGDRVPVDGDVLASELGEIDESLVTGESDPVVKTVGDTVLAGGFVVAGEVAVRATAVGRHGWAAQLVSEASRFRVTASEPLTWIDRFLRHVAWLIVAVGALLVISRLLGHHGVAGAVASGVGGVLPMIPEGLVLLTGIAFTVGVLRLDKRRCLVQELAAVDVLARVDVLCLDKTGTLTDAVLNLSELRVPAGAEQAARRVLAALVGTEPRPNPTSQAIASGVGASPGWPVTASVPFASARKWGGAAFGEHGAWVLGAADVLLAESDPYRADAELLAAEGLRVLALAKVDEHALALPDRVRDLTAVALVVLQQRLRPDAEHTLRYFEQRGVAVKVISGDNAASVGAVATALGVPGADHPMDARGLPEDVEGLAEVLERRSVFGRVNAQQKRAFVAALRSRGHVVAMTGDGVNDVLALRDADLGVAMGSGSGATRSVARIVLLDDDFAVLPSVVAEGRRVLGNVERVASLFLTKTFYAAVLALAVGVAGLPLPFLPRQVALVGALTIGIPGCVLALAPSTERAQPDLVPRVLRFAAPAGVICAAATLAAYWLARVSGFTGPVEDRYTATLALFLVAMWALIQVCRPYTWWRACLVAVMALAFAATAAVGRTRGYFAIDLTHPSNDLLALGVGIAGAAALTLFVRTSDVDA
jgi:cation-transporting ATPase E